MKPAKTLIVVADGQCARFFLHEGIGHGLKPALDEEMQQELPPSREIVTERPGRAATPMGTQGRHTLSYTVDYHEFEKERFAHQVGDLLDKLRTRSRFDRLVLVAPPKTLGALRDALDKRTYDLVTGELHKDLTHMEPAQLESPLGAVMAV